MGALRLGFYCGTGLVAWGIRTATWSPYDHVAFLLPDGSVLDSQLGVGVAHHPLVRAPDATFDIAVPKAIQDAAVAWAFSQVGAGYDLRAVIGIELHQDWLTRGSYMCSEFVSAAFEDACYPLLRSANVNRITPGTLLLSPYLEPTSF